jgi:hypothetical protein
MNPELNTNIQEYIEILRKKGKNKEIKSIVKPVVKPELTASPVVNKTSTINKYPIVYPTAANKAKTTLNITPAKTPQTQFTDTQKMLESILKELNDSINNTTSPTTPSPTTTSPTTTSPTTTSPTTISPTTPSPITPSPITTSPTTISPTTTSPTTISPTTISPTTTSPTTISPITTSPTIPSQIPSPNYYPNPYPCFPYNNLQQGPSGMNGTTIDPAILATTIATALTPIVNANTQALTQIVNSNTTALDKLNNSINKSFANNNISNTNNTKLIVDSIDNLGDKISANKQPDINTALANLSNAISQLNPVPSNPVSTNTEPTNTVSTNPVSTNTELTNPASTNTEPTNTESTNTVSTNTDLKQGLIEVILEKLNTINEPEEIEKGRNQIEKGSEELVSGLNNP